MQIIDNKALVFNTRKANQITSIIPKSKVLENNGDVDQVIVNWGFDEVQLLRNLGIRDVPSPILGRYEWPGMFTPFDHQRTTAEFLTLHPRCFVFNEAGTGKTSGLMVVDSFERDFYVNSKVLTAYNKPTSFNAVQASMPYSTQNNYALFNSYTDQTRVQVDNIEVAMYKDNVGIPGMFEVAVNKPVGNVNVRYSAGMFSEANTWLGNSVSGFSSQGNNVASTTQFIGVGASQAFGDTKVYANAQHGVTFTRASSTNIKNISPALSYTWTLGAEHKLNAKNTLGMMFYQPVSVYHAKADITAPVGLDSEFNIIQQHRGSLAADVRELRAGVYYKFNEKNSTDVTAFLENRQNFRGQEGVKDHAVGFVVNQRF
jgi:hypothetical protein